MKTLFEKMRANRVKLEKANRPQGRKMSYQEAQEWKNQESRRALDRMMSKTYGEQIQPVDIYGPCNMSGVPGSAW